MNEAKNLQRKIVQEISVDEDNDNDYYHDQQHNIQ